jgi:hypothetical protein
VLLHQQVTRSISVCPWTGQGGGGMMACQDWGQVQRESGKRIVPPPKWMRSRSGGVTLEHSHDRTSGE